jgi:TolA-binding protein
MPENADQGIPQEGFNAHTFIEQNRSRIGLIAALLAVGLVVFGVVQAVAHKRNQAATQALAAATDTAGYQKVLDQYASTTAGGDAALLLAAKQREEKKYEESAATLRNFIANHSSHPLISGAWLSLGATIEAQGKLDDAMQTYSDLISKFSTSYSTPFAMMAQANIQREKGNTDEARRTLENMMSQFPDSPVTQEGQRLMQMLPGK